MQHFNMIFLSSWYFISFDSVSQAKPQNFIKKLSEPNGKTSLQSSKLVAKNIPCSAASWSRSAWRCRQSWTHVQLPILSRSVVAQSKFVQCSQNAKRLLALAKSQIENLFCRRSETHIRYECSYNTYTIRWPAEKGANGFKSARGDEAALFKYQKSRRRKLVCAVWQSMVHGMASYGRFNFNVWFLGAACAFTIYIRTIHKFCKYNTNNPMR